MGQAERGRVFFAIWPEQPVREALFEAALAAQDECGGRAMRAEKIHLTLFFVGDVDRSRIRELEACAASVATPAFELMTGVLGYWRHNRIVWAGARQTPPALGALVTALSANLGRAGWHGVERPYVPHVTLLRNAKRAPQAKTVDAPSWLVREIALVESAGGLYQTLAKWPLRPPV